jgi:hypothetical protein
MKRITSRQITDELYPPKDELLALLADEGETSLAQYFTGYERAAQKYLRRNRFDPSTQTVEAFFDDLCRHMAVVAVDFQNRQERIEELLGKLRDKRCRAVRRLRLYALRILAAVGCRRQPHLNVAEMQSLSDHLNAQGYGTFINLASTGSVYLLAWKDGAGFEVRLSDHDPSPSCNVDADCRTIQQVRAAVELLKSRRTLIVEDD